MADHVEELARKYDVSVEAVQVLQDALERGGGRQAQFSHKDLGGMGQWSAGGMTQVGDMFNTALKDKVNAICTDLAHQQPEPRHETPEQDSKPPSARSKNWWPDKFGQPSATGSQNGMRYACFPDAHRVVVEQAAGITVYDSGDHRISGVSQSQSGSQELNFTSQNGSVRAADLPVAG